ncbi:hypothetical protein IWZ03DRAFT_361129 [Phyllosticta citriasiana]|uniref:Uncharacterized protein n=1 Tax=Phyllosticta citriasiana TaxID=595635 RepID=A0ABR1KGS3_9PEZI
MSSLYEREDRYLVLVHSFSREPETLLVSFEKGIRIAQARHTIRHALDQRLWCHELRPEDAKMDLRAGSVRGRLLGDGEVLREAVPHIGSVAAMMRRDIFRSSSSRTIFVLRIMTEILHLSMLALGIMLVEDLQWTLASRPGGVSLASTREQAHWGLLRLFLSAGWKDKMLSFWRLVLILAIPLPAVIIMGDIAIKPVFFNKSSYDARDAMAGMRGVVPDDRRLDPGNAPDDLVRHSDATAHVVPEVQSYQVECGEVGDLESLRKFGKCFALGGAAAAALWCAGVGTKHELIFGTAYCPVSQQWNQSCLSDRRWMESLSFATSFFFYRRSATIAFSRNVCGLEKRLFRRFLAVALESFNVNSLGAHDDAWNLTTPREGLPASMYTQVDVSVMSWQIIARRISFALFIGMSLVLLAVAAAVLWYTSGTKTVSPNRIGFPTLEFAVHTDHERFNRAATTLGDHGGKFAVADKLKIERVVIRKEQNDIAREYFEPCKDFVV